MCDYSLEHIAVAKATQGMKVISTVFPNTITRGFSEAGSSVVTPVAVCLLPGTELAFDADVKVDHVLGFYPMKNLRERTAKFRQINLDRPHDHHDVLEFPSGRIVPLTRLVAGQIATVLQLPTEKPITEEQPAEQPTEQPAPAEVAPVEAEPVTRDLVDA